MANASVHASSTMREANVLERIGSAGEGNATTHSFPQRIYEGWSGVRGFIYGLKVAWVSVASVVLGAFLYLAAPQVQDLFLEVTGNPTRSLAFWLLFYLSVMVAWGLPVYVSSRWILSRFEQVGPADVFPDIRPVRTWVRRVVPPLLAVGCFVAVLAGQLTELANAPSLVGLADESKFSCNEWICLPTEMAKGLVEEWAKHSGSGTVIFITYGILLALVFWLYLHRCLNFWVFRAGRIGGKIIWWVVTTIVLVPLLLTLFGFAHFAIREWSINLGLGHLAILPGLTLLVAYLAWRGLKPNSAGTATPIGCLLLRLRGISSVSNEATATREIVVPLYYLALATSLLLAAIAIFSNPVHVAGYVYRAPLLPIVLGIFVAPLTYFSYWSVRYRAPLLLMGILVGALVTLVLGDTDDVRTIPTLASRESLQRAVGQWAAVNGCDVTTRENARGCPSPFIISVAGGASRSAFFFADVIGSVLDDTTRVVRKSTEHAISSRDGTRILTNSGDNIPRLWDGKTGQFIATLEGHERPVTSAFSTDGTRIITFASGEVDPQLWDGKTGQMVGALKGHDHPIMSAIFSPDGQHILTTAHREKDVGLWDGKTGQMIVVLRGHEHPVMNAIFSPAGTRILTISYGDKSAWLWNTKTGDKITALEGHSSPVTSFAFSPEGTRIVTTEAAADDSPRLWDGNTGQWIATLEGLVIPKTSSADFFSPDGARILTNSGNTSRLWNAKTGKEIASLEGKVGTWTADGSRIVTIPTNNKTALLWDGYTGKAIATLRGHEGFVRRAVFSADSARILTIGHTDTPPWDSTPRLWDGRTGQEIAALQGHEGLVMKGVFSPDGARIITRASGEKTASLWGGKTGQRIAILEGHEGPVQEITFSPDGTRVLTTARGDKTVRFWNGKTGERIATLEGHEGLWLSAVFSPEGAQIITTSEDGSMGIWSGESGNNIAFLKSHSEASQLQPFAKQLFAVSGVSGGALGAVVTYAALADSQRVDRATNGVGNPPCKKDVPDTDWFLPYVGKRQAGSDVSETVSDTTSPISPLEVQKSWRGCLQLLLAGDFISPVFLSLLSADRAAVLEQAWEFRYAKLTGQKENDSTLGKSLITLRRDVLKDEGNWLPIILLNATSVTTGRRVVTSDVDTLTWHQWDAPDRLFSDAYDFHELSAYSSESPRRSGVREQRDVRLSTAASMSARFPILSPHGNIRDSDDRIIDRVVDGGYFENFGASTAGELAGELKKFGLKPFIILVSNEPFTSGIACIRAGSSLEYPSAPQATWFPLLRSPLNAVFATRQARSSYAAANLCSWISDEDRFAFIAVSPDQTNPNKALSMNWWLSKNVQKYLDQQLKLTANAAEFRKIKVARKLLQKL